MEQINRVEIKGNVGNIRIYDFDNTQTANFSVVTNYVYKNREGNGIVETTWFNVNAWKGKNIADFSKLQKGCAVYVTGRMREREYTSSDGSIRHVLEVIANRLDIIQEDEQYKAE